MMEFNGETKTKMRKKKKNFHKYNEYSSYTNREMFTFTYLSDRLERSGVKTAKPIAVNDMIRLT